MLTLFTLIYLSDPFSAKKKTSLLYPQGASLTCAYLTYFKEQTDYVEGKELNFRPAKMKQILGCIAVAVGFFFLIQLGKMFLQKITIISKIVNLLSA